ncbi:MAG: hypothetical protein ACJ79W_02300 [Myxococcales bacterium]
MRSEIADVVDLALAVAAAFDRSGVPYFLGGSLASSLQGEPRATNDIDFVIEIDEARIPLLSAALGTDFDVDETALAEAVRTRGSWNIFYLPFVTKIDLFVKGDAPYDQSEFARRRQVEVRPGKALYLKSPEDSVLRKLRWYVDGGSASERQLRDVIEILSVNSGRLDEGYLDEWARQLAVSDELRRARDQAAAR